MSISWGTLPDWLVAVGTIAAVVTALFLSRSDRKEARKERSDNERAQARLIYPTGFTQAPDEVTVAIVNHSALPFHRVRIVSLEHSRNPKVVWELISSPAGTDKAMWPNLPAGEKFMVRYRAPHEARAGGWGRNIVETSRGLEDFTIQYEYEDANGLGWKRVNMDNPARNLQ